jgi:hypothetical protein
MTQLERRIRAKSNMLRKAGGTLEDVGVRCVTLDYLRKVRALSRMTLGDYQNAHVNATFAEYDRENPVRVTRTVGKACWEALEKDRMAQDSLRNLVGRVS